MTSKARNLTSTRSKSAVVAEIAGTHYESTSGVCPHCGEEVQHWDLYAKQPYLEGSATKYITRWRQKGGVTDLRKAISVIEKLIAIETLKPSV
jgi:hypothetical protein